MATVKSFLKRISSFDTNKAIDTAFETTLPAILAKNKEQLYHGVNNEGRMIGDTENIADGRRNTYKYYFLEDEDRTYAESKLDQNPLPGFGYPDLYRTGNFYKGMTLKLEGSKLVFDSSDSKTPDLVEKYPGIFGLMPELKREVIAEDLRPNIKIEFTKGTGLKFGSK